SAGCSELTDAGQRLSADLETAALRAISEAYRDLNATSFSRKLRRPQIELTDASTRLGAWLRPHRRLQISRKLLVVHGWGAVIEVLKHEMAHQYVDEVLGLDRESAHGPSFRRVCEERGFDARAFGVPSPGDAAAAPVL